MCSQVGQLYVEFTTEDHAENARLLKLAKETYPGKKIKIIPKSYHIVTGTSASVLLSENPNDLQRATFGYYLEFRGKSNWRFNVRVEGGFHNEDDDPNYNGPFEIFSNPYASDVIYSQRCVIPVSFFVENPLNSKVKRKFIIRKRSSEIEYPTFFLGGIYRHIVDKETGELTYAFVLITTVGNVLMQHIGHPRSPLVIPAGGIDEFLDARLTRQQLETFFKPFDARQFETFEVDPIIAKRTIPYDADDDRLGKPISEIFTPG